MKCGASSGNAKIIVLYLYLQYLVAIDLLKNIKNSKKCNQNVACFSGGLSAPLFHRFWFDFDLHVGSILGYLLTFLALIFEGDFCHRLLKGS